MYFSIKHLNTPVFKTYASSFRAYQLSSEREIMITRSDFLVLLNSLTSSYLRRDIALMEHIQHLATRMVKGMRESPYEDRLRQLNIFSLERHRLRGDLILAYNTFFLSLTLIFTYHLAVLLIFAQSPTKNHSNRSRSHKFTMLL